MKKYKVLPCLFPEYMEGHVWTNDSYIDKGYVVIKRGNKKIYTFNRKLDNNYQDQLNARRKSSRISFKEDILVLSEYYRDKLDVKKNEEYELEIIQTKSYWVKLQAYWSHPHPYIKLSSRLAIISLLIGVISLIISVSSCCSKKESLYENKTKNETEQS